MSTSIRLILLWVSQAARVLVDGCLRLVAMLEWAGASAEGRLSAWHLVTAVFVAPFVVLAPLNGCISNALPRRWVLACSAAFSLAAVVVFAVLNGPWLWCVAFVAVGAALNSAARYAILPAAARDADMALPRLSAWIELGAAAAVVSSVALGVFLPQDGWPGDGLPLRPLAVAVLVGLNLLCLLGALPAVFPSDVRRPEPPLQAVAGFFRDARRIARDRFAGSSLFALASFQGLVTAGAGALVVNTVGTDKDGLLGSLMLGCAGAALGSAAAALVGHPRRSLGLVPLGAVGLLGALCWALLSRSPGADVPLLPCLLLGMMGGLLNSPLRAAYLGAIPVDARGNGTAVMNTAIYTTTALLCGGLVGLSEGGVLTSPQAQLLFLTVIAGVGAVLVCLFLFRVVLELVTAWLVWPFYDIRAHGPGIDRLPLQGPLLVVSNHTAYMDPFWVGKVSPRWLTPMMTSVFYDKPILNWLMRNIVKAIRVEVGKRFRRHMPELAKAVEVLKSGEAVLIFPEGRLRRKEEQLLQPFGQGAWHILREAPNTPVVVCWIEGGWGSYASYKDGPPFANKRLDWRRPIDVSVAEPEIIPPGVLADHHLMREYLWRACLECRRHIGLEVPNESTVTTEDLQAEIHPLTS